MASFQEVINELNLSKDSDGRRRWFNREISRLRERIRELEGEEK